MISNLIIEDVKSALGSRVNVPITRYMEARLDEVMQQLLFADEKAVKNLQGRAQEIQGFLDLLNKAREST